MDELKFHVFHCLLGVRTDIFEFKLEGGSFELFRPLAEVIEEADVHDPADIELLIAANVHCDDRVLHDHRTATLALKSANPVANLRLKSINDCNPSFVGQTVLIKLDSFSVFIIMIDRCEIFFD